MAYKKPKMNKFNKAEMLNNVATQSSCGSTSSTNCGSHHMSNPGNPSDCGYTGISGCSNYAQNDKPICSGGVWGGGGTCLPDSSNDGCGTHSGNPDCGQYANEGWSPGWGNDQLVSIEIDPETNAITITADSSYPIDQLAELCNELYG